MNCAVYQSAQFVRAAGRLEYDLRAELNHARVHTGAGDGALARFQRLRQLRNCPSGARSRIEICELGMVEQVKEFRAKLQRGLFGEMRGLDQRNVKVELARSQKNAHSAIAKQGGASRARGLASHGDTVR